MFTDDLPVSQRRFAVAEAIAHLERLVAEDRAGRARRDGLPVYAAA
ncbi:MAG: hypothetical protein ACRDNX_05455 [Gaiellaceae bacterium]